MFLQPAGSYDNPSHSGIAQDVSGQLQSNFKTFLAFYT